jgi:thioredoxin 1
MDPLRLHAGAHLRHHRVPNLVDVMFFRYLIHRCRTFDPGAWFLSQFPHFTFNNIQAELCEADHGSSGQFGFIPKPPGETMASELIKHVSDASFEADVLKSPLPVLVDYWAEWCGPCKMIAPILDEVSGTYEGKLQIAKMNVDENREIPAKFGIRGIPTLMVFKDGQLAATKVGAMSKAQLTAFIDQQL